MNPRAGLRRLGMRAYFVPGERPMEIERLRPGRFRVRPLGMERTFYFQQFRRLTEARAAAEKWAGKYPYDDVPECCRRWKPGVSL